MDSRRSCARGLIGLFCCGVFFLGAPAALAEDAFKAVTVRRTQVDTEMERLKLRLFQNVDYPLRLQAANDQLRLAEAKRDSLKRQIAEYERFKTNAFFLTLENRRIELMEAEMEVKRLKKEKLLMQLNARDEFRLRKLELQRAEQELSQVY